MATVQRRGYLVCLWPNPYERVLVVTEHAPLWLERHIYSRLNDDQFEAFMTAWLAGDYVQRCALLSRAESQAAKPRLEPDNLPELVSRLRGYGLNEAADFFESVKPVEVRDSTAGRGNAYGDPDDTPWPVLDHQTWLGRNAIPSRAELNASVPEAPAPGEKRTPDEWCQRYGISIADPDGWRGKNDPPWYEPITLPDFYQRAMRCTIRNVVLVDWESIRRDAERSKPWQPCADCNDPSFCEKSTADLCP